MQAEEVRADLSERGDTSLIGCGARELRAHVESCDVRNKTSLCQNEQWPSAGVESEAETPERVSHCPRRRTRRQSVLPYISSTKTLFRWTRGGKIEVRPPRRPFCGRGTAASQPRSSAAIPSTAVSSAKWPSLCLGLPKMCKIPPPNRASCTKWEIYTDIKSRASNTGFCP